MLGTSNKIVDGRLPKTKLGTPIVPLELVTNLPVGGTPSFTLRRVGQRQRAFPGMVYNGVHKSPRITVRHDFSSKHNFSPSPLFSA